MTDRDPRTIAPPGTRQDRVPADLALLDDVETLAVLWRVWQTQFVRAGNLVPKKASLQMQALKTILPNVIISERVDDAMVRIRLAGSHVDEMFGGGLTGANTITLSPPAQQAAIARVYRNIVDVPAGFYISESLLMRDGRVNRNDALVLPLADNTSGELRFYIGAYHLGRNSFEARMASEAAIVHRNIDAFGYLDLGFGLPE